MASKNKGRKSSSVFQFVINNFSSFGASEVTEGFFVGKTPWKVTVKRTQDNDEGGGMGSSYLGYYVSCEGLESKNDINLKLGRTLLRSCQATVYLDILHGKEEDGVEPLERGFKHNFRSSKKVGFSSFSRLDEVKDPNLGWMNDDKVRFEVTVNSEGVVLEPSILENPSKKIKMDSVIDLTKEDDEGNDTDSKGAPEKPADFPGRDPNIQYNVPHVVMGLHGQEERITPVMVNGKTVWLGVVNRTKVEATKEEGSQIEQPIEATDILIKGKKFPAKTPKTDVCTGSLKTQPSSIKISKINSNNNNNTDQKPKPKHFKHLDMVAKRSPNNK